MVKNSSPDPPFISHYAIIQGEMGLFLLSDTYASAPIAERAISYSEDDMKKNIKSMRQCEDPSVGLLQPQKASCRRRMCLSHCITNDSFIY